MKTEAYKMNHSAKVCCKFCKLKETSLLPMLKMSRLLIPAEIEKWDALKEKGIITEEEYNLKKKQLLNL